MYDPRIFNDWRRARTRYLACRSRRPYSCRRMALAAHPEKEVVWKKLESKTTPPRHVHEPVCMTIFADREEAGRELGKRLALYCGKDAVVLALPRGGVVLGYEVARALQVPLDIIVPRKIGHPSNPEYAIGAVDEKGTRILNESEAKMVDAKWLEEETARQKAEAERRVKRYRGSKKALSLKGKTVILVDDGIATGLTMQLAVRRAAAESAARIIVAVPVAPPEPLEMLAEEGAEIVVLEPPEDFLSAVGAHYLHFEQVSDEEVVRLLQGWY